MEHGVKLEAGLPTTGTMLGDFRVIQLLGQGGCGAVFEALQERLEREVALKVVLPSIAERVPGVAKRFLREIDLAKRLEHPNIVRLYDFGQSAEGLLWMAMELVRGPELKDVLSEEGPLAPKRAHKIALQALSGLAEAHAHKIVHRDLKPSNIMLTTKGADRDVVKLLDFGIGKALGELENKDLHDLTGSFGDAFGTPRYTAPELLKNEGVGPHSDIYTFGLILFEMLTGKPAVDADTVYGCLSRQISEELVLPDWLAASPFGPIIKKAVEKDWNKRHTSALEFHEVLSAIDPNDINQPTDTTAVSISAVDTGKLSSLKTGKTSLKDLIPKKKKGGADFLARLRSKASATKGNKSSSSLPRLGTGSMAKPKRPTGTLDVPDLSVEEPDAKTVAVSAPSKPPPRPPKAPKGRDLAVPDLSVDDDPQEKTVAASAPALAQLKSGAFAKPRIADGPSAEEEQSSSVLEQVQSGDFDLPDLSEEDEDENVHAMRTVAAPLSELKALSEQAFADREEDDSDAASTARMSAPPADLIEKMMSDELHHEAPAEVVMFIKRESGQSNLCMAYSLSTKGVRIAQVAPPLAVEDTVELELDPENQESFSLTARVERIDKGELHLVFEEHTHLDQLQQILDNPQRSAERVEAEVEVLVIHDSNRVLSQTVDISRGGMLIKASKKLEADVFNLVELRFELDLGDSIQSFQLEAKIVRDELDGNLGLQFTNADKIDIQRLDRFVTHTRENLDSFGLLEWQAPSTAEYEAIELGEAGLPTLESKDKDDPNEKLLVLPQTDGFLTETSTKRLALVAVLLLVAVVILVLLLSGGEDGSDSSAQASGTPAETASPENQANTASDETPPGETAEAAKTEDNGSTAPDEKGEPTEDRAGEVAESNEGVDFELDTAGTEPALPTQITLQLTSTPPGASVKHGETLLCEPTPCSVQLDYAETGIALTLVRDAHETQQITVVPTKDDAIEVTLVASAKPVTSSKKKRKKKRKKKQDPFAVSTD